MMVGIRKFSIAVGVVCGLSGVLGTTVPLHAETLRIGAAYSLKAAFQEILPMFEREYGSTVQVVYGPSHTLRQQIEKGAAIDVFLPAAAEEVEILAKKGLTLNGGPRTYAQTSLVLVMSTASRATPISFGDAPEDRATRIALADPRTTALGEITARSLTKLNPAYRNRFRVLHAQHSEDIMNLVHTGEAEVGIVYRVDAINNSGQVRIIDENPARLRVPVRFGVAVVSTCREALLPVAEEFFHFMTSARIEKLLLKYGFDSVPLDAMPSHELRAESRGIGFKP